MDTLSKQKVIRIEDEEGYGPYSTCKDEIRNFMYKVHARWGREGIYCPTPCGDKGIDRQVYPYERCAFLNKEQMSKWFKEKELVELIEMGMKVKEQEACVTAIGEYQVLINKE